MIQQIDLAVTDLWSSVCLVYKEEFRGDLIKDGKYLHWEEITTAREPFSLTTEGAGGL